VRPTDKLRIAILGLVIMIFIGTVSYNAVEGWDLLDALYATIVTLSTVGYGDFFPRSEAGKIFTVVFVIFGVGIMFYTVVLMAETVVDVRLRSILGRDKFGKVISRMSNHIIICGCGRIGHLIARELAAAKRDFVVIENNPETVEKIQEEGFICCKGDATSDKVLLEAGIKRARAIVCVLPTDAENLYVILTAKELNPEIFILSRAEEEESEHRLVRAGADRVMSPYMLGGIRMAMAILRPAMLDFIEITTRRQSLELQMEELEICEGSPVIGKTLEESDIRHSFGLIIVAVKKESGRMIFNPMAHYVIEKGDKLIALGEEENVRRFSQVCIG